MENAVQMIVLYLYTPDGYTMHSCPPTKGSEFKCLTSERPYFLSPELK